MPCQLQFPAAPVACGILGFCTAYIYIYIYIYMHCGLCKRVCIAIYAYMQVIYVYIEPYKHIYRSYIYIYVCLVFLFIFMRFVFCMCVNGCKWVKIHAPLHIKAPPNEESRPQLCAAKLTYIHIAKGDQAFVTMGRLLICMV